MRELKEDWNGDGGGGQSWEGPVVRRGGVQGQGRGRERSRAMGSLARTQRVGWVVLVDGPGPGLGRSGWVRWWMRWWE
jgi:hypothetical protein